MGETARNAPRKSSSSAKQTGEIGGIVGASTTPPSILPFFVYILTSTHYFDLNSQNPLNYGGGGGAYKFTLIELLVVLLVLGILMAIAIPLIGGVRAAARNAKCRSNLKQLHTAVMAHATGNLEEILPNIPGNDMDILVQGGYIEADSKLGDCPGHIGAQTIRSASYQGGAKLDGATSLADNSITAQSVIREDTNIDHHKAGKNKILLDGSFRQQQGSGKKAIADPGHAGPDPVVPVIPDHDPWWVQVQALRLVAGFVYGIV